jgi:hypothetical protein
VLLHCPPPCLEVLVNVMPYYIFDKHISSAEGFDPTNMLGDAVSYSTRESAHQNCPFGHTVVFRPSDEELATWRDRERYRFQTGIYTRVPWHEHEYRFDLRFTHYAHLSIDCPGLIAYTADEEKGIHDRQTRIRPGRYLEQFYSQFFSKEDIAHYVALCAADNLTLHFAMTQDEIVSVYMHGPSSCMDGHHMADREIRSKIHPSAVYAGPDLAVAYVGPIDSASQRSVVWPKKKSYQRIYGTGPLETLLHRAGYSKNGIDGARIRKIIMGESFLMPYIDGCEHATDDDEYLILDDDGEINTQVTTGRSECCRPRSRCEHCGDQYDEDDSGCSDRLCSSCLENVWRCVNCNDESFFEENQHCYDGEPYCQSCFDALHQECADENCSQRWIEEDEFTAAETTVRKTRELSDLCRSCAARYSWCDACEVSYDTDTCPDCDRTPRCDKTLDLFKTEDPHAAF